MEKELNSKQIDYERSAASEPRRCTNSVSDSAVKTTRDMTIIPFGTIEVKGVIKAPNNYICVNFVIDDLPEYQCCKDIAVMQQIQILKPGSNKIPVVLQNLSCRVLKIRKGMKIAHVEASNVDPSLMAS